MPRVARYHHDAAVTSSAVERHRLHPLRYVGAMTTPAEGKKAPAFTLLDQNETKVQLSKLAGTKVLVYFYP